MKNTEIIDAIWSVSRYHGNTIGAIFKLSEECPQISTTMLFLMLENTCRIKLDDFNTASISKLYSKLNEQGFLTDAELQFINSNENSLRVIRNKMAHRNVIKHCFIVNENGQDIVYPFTETSTWKYFFNKYSNVILSIIYNLFCSDILGFSPIDTFPQLSQNKIILKELSVKDIFRLKGFSDNDINKIIFTTTSESEQYILAENASDINMISSILKNLFK